MPLKKKWEITRKYNAINKFKQQFHRDMPDKYITGKSSGIGRESAALLPPYQKPDIDHLEIRTRDKELRTMNYSFQVGKKWEITGKYNA
jgi:hypothetical protein